MLAATHEFVSGLSQAQDFSEMVRIQGELHAIPSERGWRANENPCRSLYENCSRCRQKTLPRYVMTANQSYLAARPTAMVSCISLYTHIVSRRGHSPTKYSPTAPAAITAIRTRPSTNDVLALARRSCATERRRSRDISPKVHYSTSISKNNRRRATALSLTRPLGGLSASLSF